MYFLFVVRINMYSYIFVYSYFTYLLYIHYI